MSSNGASLMPSNTGALRVSKLTMLLIDIPFTTGRALGSHPSSGWSFAPLLNLRGTFTLSIVMLCMVTFTTYPPLPMSVLILTPAAESLTLFGALRGAKIVMSLITTLLKEPKVKPPPRRNVELGPTALSEGLHKFHRPPKRRRIGRFPIAYSAEVGDRAHHLPGRIKRGEEVGAGRLVVGPLEPGPPLLQARNETQGRDNNFVLGDLEAEESNHSEEKEHDHP
nr:hypothetical protein CUMW_220760 [Ipomoea batatas]